MQEKMLQKYQTIQTLLIMVSISSIPYLMLQMAYISLDSELYGFLIFQINLDQDPVLLDSILQQPTMIYFTILSDQFFFLVNL